MISSTTCQFSPTITGLILIDCWEYSDMPSIHFAKAQQLHHFYQNLINRVKQFDIKYVINAMTHQDINCIDLNIDNMILSRLPNSTITTLDDFKNCIVNTLDNSVTQWYLAGQSWQQCLHNNDIGINCLGTKIKSLGCNFYADQTSFFSELNMSVLHEDFEKDQTHWKYLPWFGYELVQH